MKCKHIKNLLKSIDLFSTAELIRFRGDSSYSTITGGIITFIIFIVFSLAFITNSISVFKRKSITSKDIVQYQIQPSEYNITVGNNGQMMFAISLLEGTREFKQQYDLTLNDIRYFDIELYKYSKKNEIQQYQQLQLQPCRRQVWANISKLGQKIYDSRYFNKSLCPVAGTLLSFQGKQSNQLFKQIYIHVKKCKDYQNISRKCGKLKSNNLIFMYEFINPYVNSIDQQPVKYYYQDRNQVYFNAQAKSRIQCKLYVTKHTLQTDNSIMPWQEKQTIDVPVMRDTIQCKDFGQFINLYLALSINKSDFIIKSTRSFQKIADYFSFLGGLFGFITFGLFMFQSFNTATYQIIIAGKLFYFHPGDPLQPHKYNFFDYLVENVYSFLSDLGCNLEWKMSQKYAKCRDEVNEQLDISVILSRISFLQSCMSVIFQQHQFRSIFLKQKPTIQQAQNIRNYHDLNKVIHQYFHSSEIINHKHTSNIPELLGPQFVKQIQTFNQKDKKIKNKQKISNKQSSQGYNQLFNIIAKLFIKFNHTQTSPFQSFQEKQMSNQMKMKVQQLKLLQENLEQVGGTYEDRLSFLKTAIKDIKRIQEQADNGNQISSKILNKFNNDSKDKNIQFSTFLLQLLNHVSEQNVKNKQQYTLQQRKKIKKISNTNKQKLKRAQSQDKMEPIQSNVRILSNHKIQK